MDRELIAYLDERFRETSQQIAGLRDETNQQIAGLRDETNQQFVGLHDEIAGLRDETSRRFERVEEGIRHTYVLIEDVRGDVRLLAEGMSAFDAKLDAVRSELKGEIGDVRSLLLQSYRDLDRRVG